jgi:adenylate cyclase
VAVARRRGARSAELRGVIALARLWQVRGELERARRLLAPRCRWFIEGADTTDLRAARKLLATLP